jgi:signal transduction histidine kinase
MFKTIFRKQFFIYIGNLLIVFVILGAAMVGMLRSYYYGQKRETLTLQARRIADGYINTYVVRRFPFLTHTSHEDHINILYRYLGASSFVAEFREQGGEPVLSVAYGSLNLFNWRENEAVVNNAVNSVPEFRETYRGEIVTVIGTMGGIFRERMMIVAYPISYMGTTQGVVFMYSPIAGIEANIREVAVLAFLCLMLSAFAGFILVYFSSRTISRPIRMISGVAKVVAAGNFNKRINVKGQDEIAQLSESFNYMAESLENTEKSRRTFISNISHDLRSPLTSVKGYVQAMLDGTIPPEKRDKYMRVVLDETERVTKMANDLLYISQFQNLDINLELSRFDLNELVSANLITFEQRVNEKNLRVEVNFAEEKSVVSADCEKIRRAVYNLIDNAVKFTPDGGAISIETSTDGQRPDRITLSIKDGGAGIAPDEQKKIFDRFYKSDQSRGMDKTGSGLGLAIVKEFIQAHGGSVRLVSAPGHGSEFSFSLPLAKEP